MPTGYTEQLYNGDDSLEHYLVRCAHAFMYSLRDAGLDAEIPLVMEPSTYYADRVQETAAELKALEALSDEETARRVATDRALWLKAKAESRAEYAKRRAVYLRVLDKIHAWKPNPALSELKKFMLSQIDVDGSAENPAERWDPFSGDGPTSDPAVWKEERRQKLVHDLDYYEQQQQQEQERVNEMNAWLAVLHEEVKKVSGAAV